jgi:hypothetical protein
MLKETFASRIAVFFLNKEINLSSKKIAPYSCCEKASEKVAKTYVLSCDSKLSRYSRYISMFKTCDVREINQILLAED